MKGLNNNDIRGSWLTGNGGLRLMVFPGNKSLFDEKLYICDGSVKVSIDSLQLLDGGKITNQHFYIIPTKSSFGTISGKSSQIDPLIPA